MNKVYFNPSKDDLLYQTIYGLPPASGEHDEQPMSIYHPEQEYWYVEKDGKLK
jgi:hypothetical protein